MSVRIVKKSCLYELEKPRKFGGTELHASNKHRHAVMASTFYFRGALLYTTALNRFSVCAAHRHQAADDNCVTVEPVCIASPKIRTLRASWKMPVT